MNYIIPVLILAVLIYAVYKKVNIYNSFVFGAKSSIQLVLDILPNIVAIFIAIEIFSASGLNNMLQQILSPIFKLFGIPKELTELILIKPFSGSGSIAALTNIFSKYGVDSYLARTACAIVGSGEAIFFVSSVYFVKTKVKKLGNIIPIALLSNFVGACVACLICRYI